MVKKLGGPAMLAGIVLLAVSFLADFIGVGDDPGFGLQQAAVAVVGGVLFLVGLVMKRKAA